MESNTIHTNKYEIGQWGRYRDSPAYGLLGAQNYELCNYRPAADYLQRVDQMIEDIRQPYDQQTFDIPSAVFANQAAEHALSSYHLADVIQQRREMAKKHMADIKFRLNDLIEERSISKMINASTNTRKAINIERQILDLEKQQRDIQNRLWKDTLDLQGNLLQERSEYLATKRRSRFLGGDGYVI